MILEIALSAIVIVLIYIVIKTKRKKPKEDDFKRQVQQPIEIFYTLKNLLLKNLVLSIREQKELRLQMMC